MWEYEPIFDPLQFAIDFMQATQRNSKAVWDKIEADRQRFKTDFPQTSLEDWLKERYGISPVKNVFLKPRKGDGVDYEGRKGFIAKITSENCMCIFDGEVEFIDLDFFSGNHSAPRGKTQWNID